MSQFENDDWACHCCDMCKQTEREGIIKLLDAELQHPEDPDNEIPNMVISAMIKLIKERINGL